MPTLISGGCKRGFDTLVQNFIVILPKCIMFCESFGFLPDNTIVVPFRVDVVFPHYILHAFNMAHVFSEYAMYIMFRDTLIAGLHG